MVGNAGISRECRDDACRMIESRLRRKRKCHMSEEPRH